MAEIEIEVIRLSDLNKDDCTKPIISLISSAISILYFDEFQKMANHVVDDKKIEIGPKQILCIPQNHKQYFDTEVEYSGHLVVFTQMFLCQTNQDVSIYNNCDLLKKIEFISILLNDEDDILLKQTILQLENELSQKNDIFYRAMAKNLILRIIAISERNLIKLNVSPVPMVDTGFESFIYRKFLDLLEIEFSSNKNVTYYAGVLMISERKLSYCVMSICGRTAKNVINERVNNEAKRLLVNSSLSVKEISYQLGFVEPTYFVKFFFKLNNQTPLQFRRAHV